LVSATGMSVFEIESSLSFFMKKSVIKRTIPYIKNKPKNALTIFHVKERNAN
jgi:hypothetical protein